MDKLLENTLRRIIREELITPPEIPGTMNFWHGGNLDNYDDVIAQKSGRYEFGPGLYLITKYDEAIKYAKGSRKLYLVTVAIGNDLEHAVINIDTVKNFILKYVMSNKKPLVMQYINARTNDNTIPAFIFNNILINNDAIKPGNTNHLRQFYLDNGIDYSIVNNPFGWGEDMMVLFNMKKIVNIIRINPKDRLVNYDL